MRNRGIYSLLIMLVFILCSCRTLPISIVKNQSPAEPEKFHFADPEKMDSGDRLALAAIDAAKLGLLEHFPLVRTNPQTKTDLKNKTNYFEFKQRNIVIAEDTESPEGIFTLNMVCESTDNFGRIDLSVNKIVFKLTEPDKKEVDLIKNSLLQGSKYSKQTKAKQFRNYMNEKIVEYQRANGLTPDGIAGKKTIASLSKGLSIIDVQELTTRVTYPQNPRLSVYIIRSETFNSNQNEFDKGFKSINKVKENALTLQEFRSFAKPGEKFVVFIYFLDRVDPAYALKWSLGDSSKKLSKAVSSVFYAEPETWPVIVQTFSIDKKEKFEQLYVNLFKTNKISTTCIASYEIE